MMLTAQSRSTALSSEIQHVLKVRAPEIITGGRRKLMSKRSTSQVKAVIQSGNNKKTTNLVEKLVSSGKSGNLDVRAVITLRKKMKEKITDKIEDQWESFMNGIGRGILIQLISEDIDPVTKSGKIAESYVRGWLSKPSDHPYIVEYAANFRVPRDFGRPGAIIITNFLDKEIHLVQIVVHNFNEGPIFFSANTWIHSRKDNPESRIIFQNQVSDILLNDFTFHFH